EMVPNCSGYPPPECTPSFAARASRSSDRWQGVISFQELAMPIWGLSQSAAPIPTARSIPREVVAGRPSVTVRPRAVRAGASRSGGAAGAAWSVRARPAAPAPPVYTGGGARGTGGRAPPAGRSEHPGAALLLAQAGEAAE